LGGSGNGHEEFQRLLFLDHECLLSYAVGLPIVRNAIYAFFSCTTFANGCAQLIYNRHGEYA